VTATPALPPSRRIGLRVARIAVVAISAYMVAITATVLRIDPDGQILPVWIAAAAVGVAYHARPSSYRLRTAWLVLVTICALGRALSLAFGGTDYLTRGQELSAALSWMVTWLCAILAALVLTADDLLNGA